VKGGILEDVPPVTVARVAALDPGVRRLDPFGGHGCRRAMIVGPDLETVADPLQGAGRDASAVEEDRADRAGQREPPQQGGARDSVSVMPRGDSPTHASPLPRKLAQGSRPESAAFGKARHNPHRRKYRPDARGRMRNTRKKGTGMAGVARRSAWR